VPLPQAAASPAAFEFRAAAAAAASGEARPRWLSPLVAPPLEHPDAPNAEGPAAFGPRGDAVALVEAGSAQSVASDGSCGCPGAAARGARPHRKNSVLDLSNFGLLLLPLLYQDPMA
jgi:hypothetical protein